MDGRELTRYYLSQKNIDSIMQEIKAVESNEELEVFMLKHGEGIVEFLGEQVDRIEKDIKAQHPEVRHVDLEVLGTVFFTERLYVVIIMFNYFCGLPQ